VLITRDGIVAYRGPAAWKDLGDAAEATLKLPAGSMKFTVNGAVPLVGEPLAVTVGTSLTAVTVIETVASLEFVLQALARKVIRCSFVSSSTHMVWMLPSG
jgi:hypothetical protein